MVSNHREMLNVALTTVVLLIISVDTTASRRGPHHPRGCGNHYKPPVDKTLVQDDHIIHDKDHIVEDLKEVLQIEDVDIEKMSEQELSFHYFKLHDSDNNRRLDGLELLRALVHTDNHHHHGDDGAQIINDTEPGEEGGQEHKKHTPQVEDFVDMIDTVLREHDSNNDGYLSYPEYILSRDIKKVEL